MNLKKQLRLYLNSTGFAVSELGRRAHVPKATIAGWLNGRKPKDLDQLRRVAHVFNISIDHLAYGEGCDMSPSVGLEALLQNALIEGLVEMKFKKIRIKKEGE